MNSIFGSPDLARLVAQRTIADRVDDARSRAEARRIRHDARVRAGRAATAPSPRPHAHLDWLLTSLRPAH